MSKIYPLSEVIDDIQQLVNSLSTQKKVAEYLGISTQYLTDILKGRRDPGPMVLRKLGFEKVIGYKYIGKNPKPPPADDEETTLRYSKFVSGQTEEL